MGDAVGCVEFCDGGFEGREGGYFDFGKESDSMLLGVVTGRIGDGLTRLRIGLVGSGRRLVTCFYRLGPRPR